MDYMRSAYVYILANLRSWRPPLYIGITTNLERRLLQHRLGSHGHTSKYRIDSLVYVELHSDPATAIGRETQLKGWTRAKKLALIRSVNPNLRSLGVPLEGSCLRLGSSLRSE